MSIAGNWKRIKIDNGVEFGKAIGATEEQLKMSGSSTSTVCYRIRLTICLKNIVRISD